MPMKKLLPFFAVLGLGACVSMPEPPDANQFVSVDPEEPPSELVGLWTGGMGPHVSTIEMTETGRGRLCSAYGTGEAVAGIKYSSGKLHTVGFGPADFSIDGEKLVMDPVDSIYPTYQFHSDPDLVEAADYCKAQLGSG